MPLYEYLCDACGHKFEKIQKFSDPLVDTCPTCGGMVHKLQSSPAIQFKGSGFYITDYPKQDHVTAEKADSAKSDKTESSTKSEKADKSEKSDKADTSEKSEKSDKSDKSDKGESSAKADKSSSSSDAASSSAPSTSTPAASTPSTKSTT